VVPMLYTDLENPTSNKIYQEVGYRRVGDTMQSRFPQNAASEPSTTALRSACDTSDGHFSLARQRLPTAPQTVPLFGASPTTRHDRIRDECMSAKGG